MLTRDKNSSRTPYSVLSISAKNGVGVFTKIVGPGWPHRPFLSLGDTALRTLPSIQHQSGSELLELDLANMWGCAIDGGVFKSGVNTHFLYSPPSLLAVKTAVERSVHEKVRIKTFPQEKVRLIDP